VAQKEGKRDDKNMSTTTSTASHLMFIKRKKKEKEKGMKEAYGKELLSRHLNERILQDEWCRVVT